MWWILDNATGIYRTAYIYDVNSNVTTRYVGNWWVVTDLSQRDVLDRPTHVEHRFASGTRTMDYQYNEMSNVTWLQRDGGVPDTYGYDRASQLTSSTLNGTASNFGYDANGNRTSMNGGGFFSPNNLNEYDWFNNQAASYDANGNLASYNGSIYVYDAQNRLRSVINGDGRVDYYYDGLNRQITKGVNGYVTFNVWDGWNLIEERGLGNTLQNAYLYGRDGILENLTTERFYYQDATGNTSHLSDRYGNLLERYTYSGFGQPSFYDASGVSLGGSNYDARHLFQGQLWTPQTGLNDHRNRQALPAMGVFLQPDPIRFKGDFANIYRYCGGNPVNQKDPFGLQAGDFYLPTSPGGITWYTGYMGSPVVQNISPYNTGVMQYNNAAALYNSSIVPAQNVSIDILSSSQFRFVLGGAQIWVGGEGVVGGFALAESGVGAIVATGGVELIESGILDVQAALAGQGSDVGEKLKPMDLATPIDFNFVSVGQSSVTLFGQGASTGRALYNAGQGWLPIGQAPADIRWAPNSGTGNFTADQTAQAAELAGGWAFNAGEGTHPVSWELR